MTTFSWGAASDTGRLRSINQDSALVADNLFAVADGMGGHQGGEVASQLAVKSLERSAGAITTADLIEGVQLANSEVFEKGSEDPSLHGMGTTLCAVALVHSDDEERIAVVNVGDSRVYLFKDGDLSQLTQDHSLVEDLVRQGRLTPEEAAVHPQRNIVTRVLGVYPDISVDSWELMPVTGDRYLLCSDGLFNEVSHDRIASVLRRLRSPQEAADELVRLANEGGGRDNITCVVVDVVDDGAGFDVEATLADPRPGHLGLRILADLADAPGLSCPVSSRVGCGTHVRLVQRLEGSRQDG
jgi:protein phosphatase